MHEPQFPQTMQDILEAVLEQDGIERSAHETMRTKLDDATRLDRLVPIHEHLCQLDARERYRPAITNSGLDPIDQAALQSSPAFGALITALRRAELVGLDVSTTLRQVVTQSSLTNANDIASVLHARVERLITRAGRRRRKTSAPLIAGLISPSFDVSNPTYKAALQEIESQITQRADWLAERAASTNEPWYRLLTNSALEPTEQRHQLIRHIAAYRELYQVRSLDPIGPSSSEDHTRLRHQNRLKGRMHEIINGGASKPVTSEPTPGSPAHPSPRVRPTIR
ncbi:MAG: hypothetical protein HOV67_16835 [Kribbellaceae bacterium]|nr:hypothetical protein [Kribbellaceae bacterium]